MDLLRLIVKEKPKGNLSDAQGQVFVGCRPQRNIADPRFAYRVCAPVPFASIGGDSCGKQFSVTAGYTCYSLCLYFVWWFNAVMVLEFNTQCLTLVLKMVLHGYYPRCISGYGVNTAGINCQKN